MSLASKSRWVDDAEDMARFMSITAPSSDNFKKSLTDVTWLKNCGIAAGGFQPGNVCARGGKGGDAAVATKPKAPSVGGDFPKTSVVDTSKWPQHNAAAKWAAKKISAMEAMSASGDIAGLSKIDAFPKSSKPNGYQKAVHEAHQKLLAQAGKTAVAPPEGSKPATAALKQEAVKPAPSSDAGPKKFAGGAIDGTGWKKTGSQLGSNPGGTYVDEHGQKYYVKTTDNRQHLSSEVTASKLYQLAGAGVTQSEQVIITGANGKPQLASAAKWQNVESYDPNNVSHRVLAKEDFAVHAWLANWDAAGMTLDNVAIGDVGGKTRAVCVDVGGSLTFRAQGGKKAFGNDAPEWESLRNKAMNAQAASVYGSMTPDQLQKSAQKLAGIKVEDVRAIVKAHYVAGDQDAMVNTLMARKESILKKAGLVGNAQTAKVQAAQEDPKPVAPKPEVQKPVNVDVPQAVAQPVSKVPMAVPAPPVFVTAANPTANQKLQAIFQAAQTGNVAAVEAIATNAESKNTYSKKAHQYKEQVLAAMKSGGVPDVQPVLSKPKIEPPSKTAVTAPKVSAPKIDEAFFPKAPKGANENANDQPKLASMLAMAKAGDHETLSKLVLDSHSANTYRHQLIAAVVAQKNAAFLPSPQTVSGSLSEIAANLGPKVKASHKVGEWLAIGQSADVSKIPEVKENWKEADWYAGNKAYHKSGNSAKQDLEFYTQEGYVMMNFALRSNTKKDWATQLASKSDTDFDDAMMAKAAIGAANAVTKASIPLETGTTLSRKHDLDAAGLVALQQSVGKVVQDKAILSTSTDPTVWVGNVQWVMQVGPGVRGLPSRDFAVKDENEVMLPPNTRLLIKQVDVNAGEAKVYAHILPFHDDQCCPP